jgi:hypothetical protein
MYRSALRHLNAPEAGMYLSRQLIEESKGLLPGLAAGTNWVTIADDAAPAAAEDPYLAQADAYLGQQQAVLQQRRAQLASLNRQLIPPPCLPERIASTAIVDKLNAPPAAATSAQVAAFPGQPFYGEEDEESEDDGP